MLFQPSSRERQNVNLHHEYSIIKDIDTLGHFTNEFIMGYVAAHIRKVPEKSEWRILWAKLLAIQKMVINKIIEVEHVIQIIQVAIIKTQKIGSAASDKFFKEFMKILDENFHEVIINPNCLQKKYYTLQPQEKKNLSEKYAKVQPYRMNIQKISAYEHKNKMKQVEEEKQRKKMNEAVRVKHQKMISKENILQKEKNEVKILQESFQSMRNMRREKKSGQEELKEKKPLFDMQIPLKKQESQKKNQKKYQQSINLLDFSFQDEPKLKNTEIKQISSQNKNLIEKKLDFSNKKLRKSNDISVNIKKTDNYLEPERKRQIRILEQPRYEPTEKMIKILSKRDQGRKKDRLNNPEIQKYIKPIESTKRIQKEVKFEQILQPHESRRRSSKKREHEFERERQRARIEFMREQNIGFEEKGEQIGIECPICCEKIKFESACPVSCGHILHYRCLNEYFKSRVEVKNFPIICPEEGCGSEITIGDIQEYIRGDLKNKYFEFSLHMFVENNSRTNWCPTPGCPALFELENNQETYKCPSCKNSYCLRCRTESHKGLTCAQVREMNNLPPEDKNFMMFARGARYKQCPSCSFWVEKSDGCDHMTCRCKYEFCYKCGGKHGDCFC